MSVSAGVAASRSIREGMRLPPMPTIGDILKIYRLRAQKRLAQNFLLDHKLTDKIVRAAPDLKNSCVLEVGPGPGALTRSILNCDIRELSVVEKDPRFFPVLDQLKEAVTIPFHINHGDILKYDLQQTFPEDCVTPWKDESLPPIRIIANLPFNVSTPLVIRWLNDISAKTGAFRYGRVPMTLMFQHEVCQRMIAWTNDRQRCRLSVMCQLYCDVKYAFSVKGTSFLPAPQVDAGVVNFVPLVEPLVTQPFGVVEKVVRNIFNTKNKHLHNSLKNLFPKNMQHLAKEMVALSGLEDNRRPIMIEAEEFVFLIKAYEEICKSFTGLRSYQKV